MSELTDDVLDDILSRLPVKDLLRFRCVAKRWCALIDSPMFIKLQLNRSLETRTNLSLIFRDYDILSSVDFDMLDDVLKLGGSVPRFDVVEVENPIKSEPRSVSSVEGSCNGLICLRLLVDEAIALLNPSTKEYKILPPPALSHDGDFESFNGIVYDPVGDDYMVVMIVHGSNFSEVMVYGLRSNMWRRICESFTYHLCWYWEPSDPPPPPGVLVNGALHWLACRDKVKVLYKIVALDPVDEKHWEVQMPQVSNCIYTRLGVLGGCLCLFYDIYDVSLYGEDNHVELWVMNDYRVEESWTELFRISLSNLNFKFTRGSCSRVLAYSKSSREVILMQMFDNFIWYDLKKKRVVNLDIRSFDPVVSVKSLVKLSHYQ